MDEKNDNDIEIKVTRYLDDKYKRVPEGYSLESIEDDYGIVSRNGNYYLIDSNGEFVTDGFEEIYRIGENRYIYGPIRRPIFPLDDNAVYGLIENGVVKTKFPNVYNLKYLGDNLFIAEHFCDKNDYDIVDKDNNVILRNVVKPFYDDGKILFQNKEGTKLYVASNTGEILSSFKIGFKFYVQAYKAGNCLIVNGDNHKYYGVDLENKKLIKINAGAKVNGCAKSECDNYYVFSNNHGYQTILDSNFNPVIRVKGKITCVFDDCFVYDDPWYNRHIVNFDNDTLISSKDGGNCFSKFGKNLILLSNNIYFDKSSKKGFDYRSFGSEYMLRDYKDGLFIMCEKKFTENTIEKENMHLIDIDMNFDIIASKIVLGNKYVMIDGAIVPRTDIKDLNGSYDLATDGDEFRKNGFDAIEENKSVKMKRLLFESKKG